VALQPQHALVLVLQTCSRTRQARQPTQQVRRKPDGVIVTV
jgi:hypothetical protein